MNKIKIVIYLLLLLFAISCEKNNFELTKNADEFFFLRNKGADIPVWVKGNTASKTMIIYLHGGPGGGALGEILLNSEFVKTITNEYSMVFFDQRGSGSSQGHFDKSLMTENQFVEDLDKLITLLINKYGSDLNIFLYGVSWGAYLGPAYLVTSDYQNKIKGWIDDSGSHNFLSSSNYGKKMLIYYAHQQISFQKNIDKWTEILNWCEQKDTIFDVNDFAQAYNYFNQAGRLMNDSILIGYTWDSKFNNQKNFFSPYSESSNISNSVFNTFAADNYKTLNLTDKLKNIKIPVLIVRGKYDFSVPQEITDEFYEKISSPTKQKVTFEKSGHAVWYNEMDKFTELFIDFIESNK